MDYYSQLRPEIIEMIPSDSKKVLDVGCGTGVLGRYLKDNGIPQVFGIELSAEAAKKAKGVLDGVVQGNIEQIEIPFEKEFFDCIVCADILEHLVDPWIMVGKLKTLLRPEGVFVASIPNVGFHKIVRGLLKGNWQYSDAGVLDRTHLRFFTLQGIEELFWINGMSIEKIHRNKASGWNMKILNFICFNKIKETLVVQYIIRAKIL